MAQISSVSGVSDLIVIVCIFDPWGFGPSSYICIVLDELDPQQYLIANYCFLIKYHYGIPLVGVTLFLHCNDGSVTWQILCYHPTITMLTHAAILNSHYCCGIKN